jgi:hypothetical protein
MKTLFSRIKQYAPGGLFGGLAGIALLSGRLHSTGEIIAAAFTFGTSVTLTIRWYLRQRMRLDATAHHARQAQLAALHKDVERIASEGKDTRIALRENTASQGELKTKVAVLEARIEQILPMLPKALELLVAINDRFEKRLPKKLEPEGEDPSLNKLEATEVAPGVTKLKKEKS